METAVQRFGLLDIVISGAAGNFLAPASGLSANGFKTVVDIDLNGTFNVFRGCYDLLRKPGASLIAITAGQAVNATMLQAHACAAKAGVNQLVRVLAMEWGPEGVRVNGISPGPVAGTEGMARLAPTGAAENAVIGRIPLRRYAQIAEVAESAVFLCSESASYITGTILDCEGGSQLGDSSTRRLERAMV
jgi:NAD(P)-dependent dehydrogenase (short-subunit alcohol dehydrogenase family)